jgi:F-type H+-transporting ATPase subunit delta
MASQVKTAQQFARQLFKMSLVDGDVSADRVGGVLAYIAKHSPPNPLLVLRAYQRLIAAEVAKGVALVEHAGAINDAMLSEIASSMTQKYGRRVNATAKANPALLAGIRVHIGDDVYESSVAGQLAALASAV